MNPTLKKGLVALALGSTVAAWSAAPNEAVS